MPNKLKAWVLGRNISGEVSGNMLTLHIDVSPTAIKGGKPDLAKRLRAVANTEGRVAVPVNAETTLYLMLLLGTKPAPKGHGNGADSNPRRLRSGMTGRKLTAAMLNDMGG